MSASTRLKSLLIALHLYLGLVLCLFAVMWFTTGIVMMYYSPPSLRDRERRAVAEEIDWKAIKLEPAAVAAKGGWDKEALREARVASLLGRPVLRALPAKGPWKGAYLDDGSPVKLGEAEALKVVQKSYGGAWDYAGLEEDGRWFRYGGLRSYKPSHRFVDSTGSGRQVMVSATTGEPVLDGNRWSGLMWLFGPGLHYFSVEPIRRFEGFWYGLMWGSSGLTVILALSGLILGVWMLRWRFLRSDPAKAVPYADGWMWWHHLIGLTFGFFTLTWAFSGFFSFNPFKKLLPSAFMNAETFQKFSAGTMTAAGFSGFKQVRGPFEGARELELSAFEGRLTAQAWGAELRPKSWSQAAKGGWSPAQPMEKPRVEAAAQRVFPGSRLAEIEALEGPDLYYYERPEKRRWRAFPVYRARLEGGETPITLYMEPYTGEVFLNHSPRSKVKRFFYQGLHGWDFKPFYQRPWWDAVIILLCLIGLGFSVTGVVVSWKWIMVRVGRKGAVEPDLVNSSTKGIT